MDAPHVGESSLSCHRKQLPFTVCSFPKVALISNLHFQVPNTLVSLGYSFPHLVVGNMLFSPQCIKSRLLEERALVVEDSHCQQCQRVPGQEWGNVRVVISGTVATVERGVLGGRNIKNHTQEGSLRPHLTNPVHPQNSTVVHPKV